VCEGIEGRLVEEYEYDFLQRRGTSQVFLDFFEHDLSAAMQWESGHARTNGRKGDGGEFFLDRAFEAVDRRVTQAALAGQAAQVHAGRVDHIAGFELSAARDRRLSQRDRTDRITLLLNRRSAFASDGAGHAGAELQPGVGGIHHRVHLRVSDITRAQDDFGLPGHCG